MVRVDEIRRLSNIVDPDYAQYAEKAISDQAI